MSGPITVSPRYEASITGIQAGGKATLRDGLAATVAGCEPVDFHLLQLGRMVDLAGLSVFRERYFEQDGLVRQVIEHGRRPVTARLGVLDVAVVACLMTRLGRFDESGASAFLERVEDDLSSVLFPRCLVAVTCEPLTVQQRLTARDDGRGAKPSRGLKALTAMSQMLTELYNEGQSPHPCVARIIDHYRDCGRLLVIDTTDLDQAAALQRTTSFVTNVSAG